MSRGKRTSITKMIKDIGLISESQSNEPKLLSKSAMEKYLNCPFGYDQHYNKRIRPCKVASALVFGIGVDAAVNSLIQDPKKDPLEAFNSSTRHIPYGKMTVGKYDYDPHLLSDKDKQEAIKTLSTFGYKGNDPDGLVKLLLAKETLSEAQGKALDYMARVSFRCKAKVLVEAYRKQVLPRIKKVHSVQKSTKAGILDLVADWDKLGNRFVIDNKTSTFEYEKNATDYSVQLIIYAIEEKCNNIMFIVLPKRLDRSYKKTCSKCGKINKGRHKLCNETVKGKRCNGKFKTKSVYTATIQIVKGKVTEQMIHNALSIRNDVQKAINNKIFPCNFATCGNRFGKPCEYRDLYWKGDMTGLEDQSKGKKK